MKILSDSAISKDDLTRMDEKQNKQILALRILLGISFVANAALSLALKFL